MKIFYDTEFIEDGRTIDLISIGMVAEDGAEYYAVSSDIDAYPDEQLHKRISGHDWLMKNVVPHLPLTREAPTRFENRWLWSLDKSSTLVKPSWVIANEVREFILSVPGPRELWADYGAYDHVALCQLWGPMIRLPKGIPMWTHDLRQEIERLGSPEVPAQESGEHNALADAHHNKVIAEFLGLLGGES